MPLTAGIDEESGLWLVKAADGRILRVYQHPPRIDVQNEQYIIAHTIDFKKNGEKWLHEYHMFTNDKIYVFQYIHHESLGRITPDEFISKCGAMTLRNNDISMSIPDDNGEDVVIMVTGNLLTIKYSSGEAVKKFILIDDILIYEKEAFMVNDSRNGRYLYFNKNGVHCIFNSGYKITYLGKNMCVDNTGTIYHLPNSMADIHNNVSLAYYDPKYDKYTTHNDCEVFPLRRQLAE